MRYESLKLDELGFGASRPRDPNGAIVGTIYSAAIMRKMLNGFMPKKEALMNYIMGTYHLDGLRTDREVHPWARKMYKVMEKLSKRFSRTKDDGEKSREIGKVGLRFKSHTDLKIGE